MATTQIHGDLRRTARLLPRNPIGARTLSLIRAATKLLVVVPSRGVETVALPSGAARTLGITVAAVDYRLAPEHPSPATVDDCMAALRWLNDQPTVRSESIAIGGASAGGGLAAAVVARVHDEGEFTPAFQLLVYPMLDDRTPDPDADTARGHRLWSGRSNAFDKAAPGAAVTRDFFDAQCAALRGALT